jgi:hypothetical protein
MKSLLFQPGQILAEPPSCGPCRTEVTTRFYKDGRMYTMTLRDKIAIEDPYLVLVKAGAFAIQEQEPYAGRLVPRSVRDFLIKSQSLVI